MNYNQRYTKMYICIFVYIHLCIYIIMRNRLGPPVEGDDFYGRDDELHFAWNQIKNENSLMMSAPRRVGKTSFAKKMFVFCQKGKLEYN